MTDAIEKHEDEGAKAFDKHLARRLLRYLKPYRVRAATSVGLVIFSSLLEIAGPAIIAIGVDLYVKPLSGANTVGNDHGRRLLVDVLEIGILIISGIGAGEFDSVESVEEIDMPPVAAELTVGSSAKAD